MRGCRLALHPWGERVRWRSAERGEVRPRPQRRSLAPADVWSREETPRSGRPRSGEDGGSEGASTAERSEAQLISTLAGQDDADRAPEDAQVVGERPVVHVVEVQADRL